MANSEYAIRKAEQRIQLPEVDLLPVISHNRQSLDMAVFGPNTYRNNLSSMQKEYFHSTQLPNITFRPATTSESISAVSYGFGSKGKVDAKRDIFDPRWLQAGPIVKWNEGVFINTHETDKTRLTNFLNNAEKHNGIYIINNKIAFVPYGTFVTGVQSVGDFARDPKTNGLARGLEFSRGKTAPKLSEVGSEKHYKEGVDVFGWNPSEDPTQKVASLYSYWCVDDGWLRVGGLNWNGGNFGYAFGVSNESRSDAPKN